MPLPLLTVFELSLLLGPESPPLLLPPVPQKAVLVVVLGLGLRDVVVRPVVDLVGVGLELPQALVDLQEENGGIMSVGHLKGRGISI